MLPPPANTIETSQIELLGLPEGWARFFLFVLILAISALVVWLYRREGRSGASRALRITLAGGRCLVFLGLAAIWVQPAIATYSLKTVPARVAVLVDVSESLSITDAGAPFASRRAAVDALLTAADGAWLKRLGERNELTVYAFGERAVARGSAWPGPDDLPPGLGLRTDVGEALSHVLDEIGARPIAGIVLLTDGQTNKGMPLDDLAAYAQRRKAPLYPIGVGSLDEPPNVWIAQLAAPATAPRGDPFELRVELSAAGLEPGATLDVELSRQPADDAAAAPTLLTTRTAPLPAEGSRAVLVFEITPEAAGEWLYRVHVRPQAEEAVTTDNTRETLVRVLEDRLRVLIVAGRPSYDYRFVTRLFERDRSIDLSCWLQSADERAIRDGNTIITELPRDAAQLYAYDAILLLDANPADLDAGWAALVRRFVDEVGGGLLVQAGAQFSSRLFADERLQPLVAILPVTPDPEAELRLTDQGTYRERSFSLLVPEEARAHPLLALQPQPAENAAAWGRLPGVWWHLPVLREKPVATVLLRHSSPAFRGRHGPAILLATQPVGSGRTAFLGFDSTWRWRATAEPAFNRFWVQMVRYLAQTRREGDSKRGLITLDRESPAVGDFVKVEARVLDEQFQPWHEPRVTARVTWADGTAQPLPLDADPAREGWFSGRLLLEQDGATLIELDLPSGATPPTIAAPPSVSAPASNIERLTKRFHSQRPDFELRALRLRADLLRELAERTGGRYAPLSEAADVPDWIENASRVEPPRRIGVQELWDEGWVLGGLAGLLAVELWFRRRNHLL